MRQTVLDVLHYLFEQYLGEGGDPALDQRRLQAELHDAGFSEPDVARAFDWLQGLSGETDDTALSVLPSATAIRVFAESEADRLSTEIRGFIHFLGHAGVLNAQCREMVIDRLMALESDEIDLDQARWVVLMVLFNQPGQEDSAAMLEDLLLDESVRCLH
jgi:Smg protein